MVIVDAFPNPQPRVYLVDSKVLYPVRHERDAKCRLSLLNIVVSVKMLVCDPVSYSKSWEVVSALVAL